MSRTLGSKLLSISLFLFMTACGGGGSNPTTLAGVDSQSTSGGGGVVTQHGSQSEPAGGGPAVPPDSDAPQTMPPDSQGGGGTNGGSTPPPDPDPRNVVQRENAKGEDEGVSTQWQIADQNYASRHEIEGYASSTSVNRGESIRLYVSTSDPEYSISIYRMGWYQGSGGRLVAGPIRRTGTRQPPPTHDADTNLIECDWIDPYVLNIPNNPDDPADWASGIYLAKLIGSSGKESYIIFIVRDDARNAAMLFQSSVTTYAAYNNWGGYSLYQLDSDGGQQAYKVSFNRPYRNPLRPSFGKGAGEFFSWEINMVRFVEREGYDVAYSTNIDTHRAPQQLLKHRAFLSVGHDEYWTKSMRDGIEAARDNGVNLAFFGANSGYWQIRLEDGRGGQAERTVVGYKYDAPGKDPMYKTDPAQATYLWRNAPINRPEAALVGVMYEYNSVDLDMVIDDCASQSWICAGTDLKKGSVLKGMLGYEVDSVAPSSPAGIVTLAMSPYTICVDSDCKNKEVKYAHMTYYTAASGAGVFATGSMNWHWGLDSYDDAQHRNRESRDVKTITQNILARFIKR